jgi:WD repeat and SOF domain-containing protein 1
MDVDYSPTGKEFVSGSYDKTLRIFEVFGHKSR